MTLITGIVRYIFAYALVGVLEIIIQTDSTFNGSRCYELQMTLTTGVKQDLKNQCQACHLHRLSWDAIRQGFHP